MTPNSRSSQPQRPRKGKPDNNNPNDAWSLRIATVSGIPIRIHFTFVLLVLVFALAGIGSGRNGGGTVLFLLGVFFCVALHELGHSIVAQRYGYTVRDIVLYPIGGVASIEGSPTPRHELAIALAGPAVNVVIAALLAGILGATGHLPSAAQLARPNMLDGSELASLLRANIFLVLFNMIPAFPMDGGRVLRALLALGLGQQRATKIAAGLGQAIAVALGIFGLQSGNLGLIVIALFVFFGAGQEGAAETSREAIEGAPVGDAMVREFQTLEVGDSLRRASEVLIATHQQDFPVVFGEEVVGVLSRGALLRGLAQSGESAYVTEAMTREVIFVKPSDPLESVLTLPDGGLQRAPALVMNEQGKLVGMVTVDNVMEFLTLRQITRARAEKQAAA